MEEAAGPVSPAASGPCGTVPLLATVPATADGTRNWELADPYLLRHAEVHAEAAGHEALDRLIEECRRLATARPRTAPPGVVPRWATDHRAGTARLHTLSGHKGAVAVIATVTDQDGIPRALTSGHDCTVIVWDLAAGERRHTLTGHTGRVRDIATITDRDGILLAVTTSSECSVMVFLDAPWTPTSTAPGNSHVAGSEAIPRYELGVLAARRDGLDHSLLPAGRRADTRLLGALDLRLDCRVAQQHLSTRLRGVGESLGRS
ncbi:hypothetical protein ACFRJ1_04980 [Streptomyces sp. NPDC056773]|uniref:hypothetical protein n=1 Tax=unclassified Streptomyces TaxID=2593676 RepID=UPI00369A3C60